MQPAQSHTGSGQLGQDWKAGLGTGRQVGPGAGKKWAWTPERGSSCFGEGQAPGSQQSWGKAPWQGAGGVQDSFWRPPDVYRENPDRGREGMLVGGS